MRSFTTKAPWVVAAVLALGTVGPSLAAARPATSTPAKSGPAEMATGKEAPTDVAPDNERARTAAGSKERWPEAPAYAERERSNRQLEQFKGGDGLYIGGSVLSVVLLIVLLVILF
jgi:hypothetical protein